MHVTHLHNTPPLPDLPPRREAIEALIASVEDRGPYPLWAREPSSEAEFAASLVLHDRELGWGIELVYDAAGRLYWIKGIRLKNAKGAA